MFGKAFLEHNKHQIRFFCSNNFQASQVILELIENLYNSITSIQENINTQTRN